jgi:hypothetical protein
MGQQNTVEKSKRPELGKNMKKDLPFVIHAPKKPENRAGRVAQVVEHLPAKCKTLSSNPSTNKKLKEV